MAIRIPIITDLQDEGLKRAKLAFGDFKKSVADAQGGMNKFKAGTKSVFDSVKANAGTFAIAGAAAFATFAAKGVKAFQDLALASGKFADATGLAVDQASRWIEVSGDIGIGSETVQAGINKMNKALGTSPQLFKDLGIEVTKTSTGATDVNQTFLNVIDKLKGIKDPAVRAKVATQLLGKGWMDMAELIQVGSVGLKKSLDGVSKSKVISAEELKKAKDFRKVMDDLKDVVEDLSLSIGQSLVPVLSDLGKVIKAGMSVRNVFKSIPGATWMAENLSPLGLTINALGGVKDAISGVVGWFSNSSPKIEVFAEDMKLARDEAEMFAGLIRKQTNPQLDAMAQKLVNAKTATDNATAAWANLLGKFQTQVDLDKLDADLMKLRETAISAFGGSKEELDAFHEQQLVVIQDFETMKSAFPPSLTTTLTIELNSMDLERLERAASLVKFLKAGIGSNGNDASIYRRVSAPIVSGARATGGPVMAGKSYLVGERGPELFTPGTSGGITSNSAMNNGTTINVTVNGGDPNSIVRALQQYVRQSGPVPVNTRAM